MKNDHVAKKILLVSFVFQNHCNLKNTYVPKNMPQGASLLQKTTLIKSKANT